MTSLTSRLMDGGLPKWDWSWSNLRGLISQADLCLRRGPYMDVAGHIFICFAICHS